MPTPGDHKTVQTRNLTYVQGIGWRYVSSAQTMATQSLDLREPESFTKD